MKALSTAASTARHTFGVAFEALLLLAIVGALIFGAASLAGIHPGGANSVFAAKGGNGGSNALGTGGGGGGHSASISLIQTTSAATVANWPSFGSDVAFAVSANVKASDVYKLWVANWCYQNGAAVYAEFQPVANGVASPFTLTWAGGGSATCTAFVFIYPDTGSPVSGGTVDYSAGG